MKIIIAYITFLLTACSNFSPKEHTDLGLTLVRVGDRFSSSSISLGTPVRRNQIGSKTLLTFCESNRSFTDIVNVLVENDVILDHHWQYYPQNGKACTVEYAAPHIEDNKILKANSFQSTKLASANLKNGRLFSAISHNMPKPISAVQVKNLDLLTFCEANNYYEDHLYVLLENNLLIDHLLISNKKSFINASSSCEFAIQQPDIENNKIFRPLTDDEKRHKQSCDFEVEPLKKRACIAAAVQEERMKSIEYSPVYDSFIIFKK
jgi:hypothetical protein